MNEREPLGVCALHDVFYLHAALKPCPAVPFSGPDLIPGWPLSTPLGGQVPCLVVLNGKSRLWGFPEVQEPRVQEPRTHRIASAMRWGSFCRCGVWPGPWEKRDVWLALFCAVCTPPGKKELVICSNAEAHFAGLRCLASLSLCHFSEGVLTLLVLQPSTHQSVKEFLPTSCFSDLGF